MARILKPLAGRTIYSVHNTQDFAEQMKTTKLMPDECSISYDVKALYTSVPIEPAIKIIKQHLENDRIATEDFHVSTTHHHAAGILFKEHPLCLSRQVL